MQSYEANFLKALFWTVAIESATLVLLLKVAFKERKFDSIEMAYAGVLPSVATLPYVWFVFPYYISDPTAYAVTVESFAVVAESFLVAHLLRVGLKRGAMLSLAANACSFLIGLLIFKTH